MKDNKREVLIIAGPNGAGKTTFARTFLSPRTSNIRFINADYIAAGLSPFAPELAAIRAGKIMLQEINKCFQEKQSFAIETTLAGKGYLKHIKQWQAAGYEIKLMFLSLTDVSISIERVARRVLQGGHNIPTPTIKRRFKAGIDLFHSDYKHLVNQWLLYDNSDNELVLLQQGDNK